MNTGNIYTKEITADKPGYTIKINLIRDAQDSYMIELWEGAKKLTNGSEVREIGTNDPNYRNVVVLKKTYRFGRAYITKEKAQEIKDAMAKLAEESPRTKQQIEYENILPGLNKIKKAVQEQADWQYKFNRAMEGEDGSSTMTRAPKNVIEETKNAYPKEAAYYKAEQYSYASHYAKSSAGRKAMERILNGEDYNQVILDMENEWRKAAEEAAWNN